MINVKELKQAIDVEADICIFGAGVAGIVTALELLDTGKKIVLIESGEEVFDQRIQALYQADSKPELFPNPLHSRLRMLGGSSNHWENSNERLDPSDFSKREWVPDSGWPITYEEVAKYYPDAERYCRVGGNGFDFSFWNQKMKFLDIVEGSDLLETAVLKHAIPPTRFFYQYKKRLLNAQNLFIYTHANLVDLDWSAETSTIQKAYFKSIGGSQHSITADIFVMAFGGIENARMLLTFNQKFDDKLGNQHDLVGRYFMEHPTIRGAQFFPLNGKLPKPYTNGNFNGDYLVSTRLKFRQSALEQQRFNNLRLIFNPASKRTLSEGISSAHILGSHLSHGEVPENFGSHIANVLEDMALVLDSFSRKEFDYTLSDDADKFGGYQILAMLEQTPHYDSRITLGDSKDELGINRAKILWKLSEGDKKLAWAALEKLAHDRQLLRYGRVRILQDEEERIWGNQLGFGQHHMGTTKMGDSEKNSVVDATCRLRGARNFYIAGSSVFPTGGHVPPTLTIVALSIKLANDLRKEHHL